MAVSFTYIPNDVLQPLFYAEVSNAKAAGGTTPRPTLLVGQALGTGFTAGIPIRLLSSGHANTLFRPGSMLARMVRSYLANDPICELWALPLADLVAGVAASTILHITGTATAAGILALYLGGQRLLVPVSNPESAVRMLDMAFMLRDEALPGAIHPITIVREEKDSEATVAQGEQILAHCLSHAASADIPVTPSVRMGMNIADGIVRAARELRSSLVLAGWKGVSALRSRIFGDRKSVV